MTDMLVFQLVPLCRHSPLPELRAFVSLFKPISVVPNTLDAKLGGLDWLCMPKMFADCISSDPSVLRENIRTYLATRAKSSWKTLLPDLDAEEDVAFKNLEGHDVLKDAERWGESGKTRTRLTKMLPYLEGPEWESVNRLLSSDNVSSEAPTSEQRSADGFEGRATLSQTERAMARLNTRTTAAAPTRFFHSQGSNEETDDEEDARGLTADYIFGHLSESQVFGKTASSSPVLPNSDLVEPVSPFAHHIESTFSASAVPIPPMIPPTPSSCRTSPHPPLPPLLSENIASPLSNSAGSIGVALDSAELPRTPVKNTFGPPIQLRTPGSTVRKRRRSQCTMSSQGSSQGDSHWESLPVLPKGPGAPLVDLRNLGTRKISQVKETHLREDQDQRDRVTKRRKLHGERAPRAELLHETECVHQTRAKPHTDAGEGSGATRALKTSNKLSFLVGSTTLISSCVPSDTSTDLGDKKPSAARLERRRIAEKLSIARPDLVDPKYSAKLGSQRTFSQLGKLNTDTFDSPHPVASELPERSASTEIARTPKIAFPSELPEYDTQVLPDVEMDYERSRVLAEQFRMEYARGLRPGLVVPRLSCLESQEEEEE